MGRVYELLDDGMHPGCGLVRGLVLEEEMTLILTVLLFAAFLATALWRRR